MNPIQNQNSQIKNQNNPWNSYYRVTIPDAINLGLVPSLSLVPALALAFQFLQKCFTAFAQFLFQPACAIAIAAGPRFGSVQVPAIISAMRIFDAEQLEIFFPVGTFLGEGRRAKTGFYPMGDTVFGHARLFDIIDILVSGNRALPQGAVLNRFEQRLFAAPFDSSFDQISHGTTAKRLAV
jgi:hypothetical protein